MPEFIASTYTHLWRTDLDAAFDELASAGFDKVELLAAPPHIDMADPDRTVERIARACRRGGLRIHSIVPSGLDVNLASPDRTMREWSVSRFVALGAMAVELGARWLITHPGRRHPLRPPPVADCVDWAVEGIERVVEGIERVNGSSASSVGVLLENTPTGLLDSAAECVVVTRRVGRERLRLCYDVANGHMVEDVDAGLRVVGEQLGLVHLSDCTRASWAHDPIGAGEIAFDRVRETLSALDYRGDVVLETLHSSDAVAGFDADRAALRDHGWN